jgi:hypothetical protein
MSTTVTIPHETYVQRELVTASVVNVALCVFFTYVFSPASAPVPLWGAQGIAFDLVPTVFMLTLIGNTVITLVARHRLREGKVAAVPDGSCGWLARQLPRRPVVRVPLLALLMTIVVVPVSVLAFWLLGVNAMKFEHYMLFKACYGPLVGALSLKCAVQAALREAARQ